MRYLGLCVICVFGALGGLGGGSDGRARAPGPTPRDDWSAYLTRSEVGADRWLAANPRWDGRGIIIAVLDTGVDVSQPGLGALPGGGVKVVDARDFTGQGDVALERARVEDGVLIGAGLEVRGVSSLADKPLGKTGYWVGVFDEKAMRRGSVEDIDGDGRNDTRFAVVAFQRADGEEVAVIDTDGDLDLSGELVRRSYRDDARFFVFGRAPKRRIAVTPHVDLGGRKVELHFDDGAHGTHCAGIAAGYRIEGREGFDGIAPGANVVSLKIGHGGLAGGATVKGSMVKAIRYASELALEQKRWVVISMSYGIGSETEGHSDIDRVLDEELQKNPWLIAAVSASNEGPGLSSVGTPAAATLAFAVAAMVTPKLAETLLGASGLKTNRIFAFSSRGGELDKPDGMAPGVAWSTVPVFNPRPVMNGTSMAAPQVAGVMALVLSAAVESEGTGTSSGIVRRALRQGARPLPGYTRLDQGPGVVDVTTTWAAMKLAKGVPREVAGFEVRTPLPGAPGRTGSASYWRVGAGLMGLGAAIGDEGNPREQVVFQVRPMIHGSVADQTIPSIFQTIALDSDVGWLSVDRRELALKGDAVMDVVVNLELAKVAGPGVHIGRVRGRQAGLWAFDLPVVVVVPFTFRDTWAETYEGKLMPGEVARVFVEVPAGASAMTAELTMRAGEGGLLLMPFEQEGRGVETYEHRASLNESAVGRFARSGAELSAGTWELTVVAPLRNVGSASFALKVTFAAIDGPDALEVEVGGGGAASAGLTLTNRMAQPFQGTLEASVIGLRRARAETMKGPRHEVTFEVGPGVGEVELELELDDATWARMTDFAWDVVDAGGQVVAQEAFGQRVARTTIAVPRLAEAATYTIELVAGLADANDARAVGVTVRELHRFRVGLPWAVEAPSGQRKPTLYPAVATRFALTTQGLPAVGNGFELVTELGLVARDGSVWQRWKLGHTAAE